MEYGRDGWADRRWRSSSRVNSPEGTAPSLRAEDRAQRSVATTYQHQKATSEIQICNVGDVQKVRSRWRQRQPRPAA